MHPSDAAYAGAHDVARQSDGVASVCPDAKADTATDLKAHALAGRHPAPALPYEYAPTESAAPHCRFRDADVCWGNAHRFLEVVAHGPFVEIDGGAYAAPALGDLDGDGDLDVVLGVEAGGELLYFENLAPGWFARRTQDANPFDGIDAGSKSAPALADLDADGDLDVVIGSYDGTVIFLENTGSREAPAFVQNDALFKIVTDAGCRWRRRRGFGHPRSRRSPTWTTTATWIWSWATSTTRSRTF